MSALSGFLGGAIVGAGTAYTKLADEQRAFRIDQTKQDALYARLLNLKRAEKGMEKSGVLDEAGLPMTNEQLESYSGDRSALMGPIDQAAEAQKIKDAGQPSQFMTQDRVVLTNGEVEEYKKIHGSFDGLIPVKLQERRDKTADQAAAEARADQRARRSESLYYARQEAREREAEARLTEARNKEERARTDYYSKGLQGTVQDRVDDIEEKWVNGDLDKHPGMPEEESLEAWKTASRIDAAVGYLKQVPPAYEKNLMRENPLLREYKNVPSVVRSGKLSGKSMEEVEKILASEGYNPKQIKMVTDYAISKGYAKYVGGRIRQVPGGFQEWELEPSLYRMKER